MPEVIKNPLPSHLSPYSIKFFKLRLKCYQAAIFDYFSIWLKTSKTNPKQRIRLLWCKNRNMHLLVWNNHTCKGRSKCLFHFRSPDPCDHEYATSSWLWLIHCLWRAHAVFALLEQQHSIDFYKEIPRIKVYLKYTLDCKRSRGHPSVIQYFLVYPLLKFWCNSTLLT